MSIIITAIAKMHAQQEYCGDVINFKTYSKNFRNKARIPNPKESRSIFKEVHEPITPEHVQEHAKISETRDGKAHFLSCVRSFAGMNEITPMMLQEPTDKMGHMQ